MLAGIVLELQEEETIINRSGYISRERIVYLLNSLLTMIGLNL